MFWAASEIVSDHTSENHDIPGNGAVLGTFTNCIAPGELSLMSHDM